MLSVVITHHCHSIEARHISLLLLLLPELVQPHLPLFTALAGAAFING